MVLVPVSAGELCDRLTILELKQERIPPSARRDAVDALLALYRTAWAGAGLPDRGSLTENDELHTVNAALWEVEDRLRAAERAGAFDAAFVADARSVYRLNDRRAAVKAALDARLGSGGTEPKFHRDAVPHGLERPGE